MRCHGLFLLTGVDISKRRDGGIRKSTMVKGKGEETPNDGATCEGNVKLAKPKHQFAVQ